MIFSASWGPTQSTTDRYDYIGRTAAMRPHDSVQQLLNVNNDDVGGCWRALYDTKAFDECRLVTLPQTSLLVNERFRYCRELVIEKRPKFKLSSLTNHHQTKKYVIEVDCWLVPVPFGLHGVTHRLDRTADGGIEPTRETCTVAFCHPLPNQQGIRHVHVFRGDLASDMIIQVTAGVYLPADEGAWPPLYQREHDRLHPTHAGVFVPLCVVSAQTDMAHWQSRYSPPDLSHVR